MILELLGLGMLGAIGKTVYDEAKKEQSSNNTNQSTTNKNYTDDSRYWNLIYSYARKYQYRKTEISYDILHEIQLKTNRDLSQIKCDYEKALNKINKKAEKAKTASMKNTSPNKNTNTTVHSEPKHNSSKRTDEMNNNNLNQISVEELIMQRINNLPRTFEYSSNAQNNNELFSDCITILAGILNTVVSSSNVNQLKQTVMIKKHRYNSIDEYNECLENNIVFELYKYDNFIKLFKMFDNNMGNLNKLNYQTFCVLMMNDSKKNVSSAKQLAQKNSFIRNLLVNYSYKDTENREYDYIFSSLKVSVIANAMQSVLYGQIDLGNKIISGKDFFKQFSSKDNIATFDTVITMGIANRLSDLY